MITPSSQYFDDRPRTAQPIAPQISQTSLTEPIVLVCSADENYVMPLATTLCSMLHHLSKDAAVKIFVLDGGISKKAKERIVQLTASRSAEIAWIKPSEAVKQWLLSRVPVTEKWPISNYYRFLIPQIIPEHFKKVIYLDTDIVVQGNLEELWNLDLENYYAMAVQDVCNRYISQTGHLTHYQDYGISPDCKYFNAGILVINLEKWRQEAVVERSLDFIQKNLDRVLFPDQDAMNIVLAGRWKELEPRWNQMHAIHEYASWQDSPYDQAAFEAAIRDPQIIHFTTVPKPWQVGCHHPAKDRYFEYLDQTAWKGWRNTVWRRLWRRVQREVQKRVSFST